MRQLDGIAIINRIDKEDGFKTYEAYDEIYELVSYMQSELEDRGKHMRTWWRGETPEETPPDGFYWMTNASETRIVEIRKGQLSIGERLSSLEAVLTKYHLHGPIPPPKLKAPK